MCTSVLQICLRTHKARIKQNASWISRFLCFGAFESAFFSFRFFFVCYNVNFDTLSITHCIGLFCRGKNVLNQKSELQRALEKHKDNLAKKQLDSYVAEKTPELEKVIADRARRLENPPKKEVKTVKKLNSSFSIIKMFCRTKKTK